MGSQTAVEETRGRSGVCANPGDDEKHTCNDREKRSRENCLRGKNRTRRANPYNPAKDPSNAAVTRGARSRLWRFAESILGSVGRTMPSPDDL